MTDLAGGVEVLSPVDFGGRPLPGETVGVYLADTTTLATLYDNRDLAAGHAVANPLTADVRGNTPFVYAVAGEYDVVTPTATFRIVVNVHPADLADALADATSSVAAETARAEAAEALLIPLAQKGAASGVATLDGAGLVPVAQLPPAALSTYLGDTVSDGAMTALTAQPGDWTVRTDYEPDRAYMLNGSDPTVLGNWRRMTFGDVISVAGRTGAVALAEADIANLVADLAALGATDTAEAAARVAADALLTPRASILGAGVGRAIRKMQAGAGIHIVVFGDSVAEGTTVDNPATDGFAIKLTADLGTRFGVTNTLNNRADSGNTVARGAFGNRFSTGLDDDPPPDVVIIIYGKNDISADGNFPTILTPGYPLANSMGGIERLIQFIHDTVPGADIVLMSENPYYPASATANTNLQAYNAALRQLAAYYGCEFVDGYSPFIAIGDFAAYMGPGGDNTHPGTLGHALMETALLAHFPADYLGPAVYPGKPSAGGLHLPARVATSLHEIGYIFHNIVGTYTGNYTDGTVNPAEGSWANTGAGWGASIHPYSTSTPGDYASGTFTGTEFFVNVDTTAATALVAELFIDGVSVYAGAWSLGKQLALGWVMGWSNPAAPGVHTWKLVLTSGTLTLDRIGYLVSPVAPPFIPDHVVQDITGTVSTINADSAGAATTVIPNTTVTLPAGWTSMDIEFVGSVQLRTTEAFGGTNNRTVQINVRVAGSSFWTRSKTMDKDTANGAVDVMSIADVAAGKTADTVFKMEITSTGATKTGWSTTGWSLRCIKHRVS